MINEESYKQLMEALSKLFEPLQDSSKESKGSSSKDSSDKSITIVSIGKAKDGVIPKKSKESMSKKSVKEPQV